MIPLEIQVDDPLATDVRALVEQHLKLMAEVTPPEDIHALGFDGLLDPSVTLYSLRRRGTLLGIGALQQIGSDHFELKSMHTATTGRGQGIGRAILDHLLAVARERGALRVSLETGSQDGFLPAIAFYRKAGFEVCGPFGDYKPGTTSVFMTLVLEG